MRLPSLAPHSKVSSSATTDSDPLVDAPPEARNVEGWLPAPPSTGFGQLWRKRYAIRIPSEPDPERVMAAWKANFSSFWPGRSSFLGPRRGIRRGAVAGVTIEIAPGATVSTGAVVTEASPVGFTLLTARGHPFAGWIRFGAQRARQTPGSIASVDVQLRASDPLYEVGLRLGGLRREDHFWKETLTALAASFGAGGPVARQAELVDRRVQWRYAGNVVYNAAIRTAAIRLVSLAGRAIRRIASRRR